MPNSSSPRRIVIMGAAGRDFHNFNVVYRDAPATRVVAFTATQIPGIAARRYPTELAGPAIQQVYTAYPHIGPVLPALIAIDKPVVRVRYEFKEVGEPKLSDLVQVFLQRGMSV